MARLTLRQSRVLACCAAAAAAAPLLYLLVWGLPPPDGAADDTAAAAATATEAEAATEAAKPHTENVPSACENSLASARHQAAALTDQLRRADRGKEELQRCTASLKDCKFHLRRVEATAVELAKAAAQKQPQQPQQPRQTPPPPPPPPPPVAAPAVAPACLGADFNANKRAFELGRADVRRWVARNTVHVISQWYHAKNEFREQELQGCIQANALNPHVARVHLLAEDGDATDEDAAEAFVLGHEKITVTPIGHRMTAKEAMEYANRALPDGSLAILINADVFLDDSIRFLGHMRAHANTSYVISRKQTMVRKGGSLVVPRTMDKVSHLRDHCVSYAGSHDAFAWVSPLPRALVNACDFQLGTVGLIFEFTHAKYRVRNPCHFIAVRHLQGDYSVDSGPTPPRFKGRLNDGGKSGLAPPMKMLE